MASTKKNIFYQGNTTISVETLPDYSQPVVIKKPSKLHPSRQSLRALENEFVITRSLNDVAGVRKALGLQRLEGQPSLILEYIDGETLRDHIGKKTFNLRQKLEIAVDLSRILAEIHQQDIIHLDLNSKNILISNKDQSVHLIDLGSSARISGNGHQKVRPDQILGTLPYISPEQTGRINRAVDERSDLYSLGVVLYELITGKLPFDSKNAMELIHHQIARVPVSPTEVSSETPQVISSIILKLLFKKTEDRYKSAYGLQADLKKCLQRLELDNTIESFPVGAVDYSSRFTLPQELYGRESELQELVSAFRSTCRDTSKIIFLSGYSGIGKTALVEEIQRPVSENSGYFIKGKFGQYLGTTPYTAFTQAFAVFVSRVLAEPEKNFNEWQAKIQAAVGDLGRILTDVIPALEDLIGAQPEVPQLGGEEAENRFNYVFINFLSRVAAEKHPLVLFIDDLQWIDEASLRLLKVIRSDFNQPGLLFIGAYRENEVNAFHPLMGFMDDQKKKGQPLRILKLDNLQPQHLETFLADALRSKNGIKALATVIYEKTQGNPFFFRRLLSALHEEGRIRYDYGINSWTWDTEDINAAGIADNVADFLAKKIAQLPEATQNILKLAACIGNRFDIATLAMISGIAEKEVVKVLNQSSSGQYVFGSDDTYEFVHDQVQQGGYALIAAEDLPQVHLQIGRLLLSNSASEKLEEDIFNIVHHFNAGVTRLKSESERMTVAELNLKAGQKTKIATAYTEGLGYIEQGLALLGPDSWKNDYDLILALHNEAAELAYLTGHYDKLEEIEGCILKNARSILDRAHVYHIRIHADISQANYLEAIETGILALAELGIKIPSEPTPEDYQRYQVEFSEAMAGRSIEELINLPVMTNRIALAAMEILAAVVHTAFVAAPQLLLPIVYQGAILSIQNGNGPRSPHFHCAVGGLLCAIVDAAPSDKASAGVKTSNQLQKVAITLLDNPNHACSKAKTLSAIAHIQPWNEPFINVLDTMLEVYEAGLETGDLVFAALGIYHYANIGLAAGMNLDEFQRKVSGYNQHVKAIGQEVNYRRIGIGLQTAHNFMTKGATPHVLKGQHFEEDQWLPDAVAMRDLSNLNFLFLNKLRLSYHFDRDDKLIEYAGEAEKYLDGVAAMINTALFRFYDSLSRLRLYDGFTDEERQETLQRVEGNQLRMRIWSENAPMNFKHKYELVAAETARVTGIIGPAMENYEKAIKGARDNQFIHEEALANELYARFWQERGNDRIAEMYMREARVLYHQWGAGAKVNHLENRYPQWFKTQTIASGQPDSPGSAGRVHTTITQPITSIQMDLDNIISASQTLSAETDLEQLLTKMMDLVMANSNAAKGVLLLRQANDWFVQARSDVTIAENEILLNLPYDPSDSDNEGLMVPECVFDYCRRSKEVLVVGDVQLDERFAQERMFQKQGMKSIACIPALNQGVLKAMLYLENRQIPDVFTLERMEILQHLSSQFAVSVENVQLYQNLSQSEERYELAVNGSAAGIWDWDIVSEKMYYSDRVKDLLGYAPNEISDTLDEFLNRLHPDDVKATQLAIAQHLEQRVPYIIDYRLRTKSDGYRWCHARGQALWDAAGKATRMTGSIADITARKQAEEGLRQSYIEIEHLKNQLEAESAYLQQEIKLEHNFEDIIGQSEALKYVLHRVQQVAPLDTHVLIMGETGTGKELMARAIHRLSPRGKRTMVKVNCAALPRELIESELFGHEKGSFTGAATTHLGRFELAKESTLFLDEIGELPFELQAKLLRVLESGEFERLGSSRTLHSDARIITATNRVLEEEVFNGRFREDLWYRLKVFPITVPPLCDRKDDIAPLVKWFVDLLARKIGKQATEISKSTMQMLQDYPWPGNIRELRHAIEAALISANGKKLNFDLPKMADVVSRKFQSFEEMERQYILEVLEAKNWKISGKDNAASTLGVPPSTLRSRMNKLGLKRT